MDFPHSIGLGITVIKLNIDDGFKHFANKELHKS